MCPLRSSCLWPTRTGDRYRFVTSRPNLDPGMTPRSEKLTRRVETMGLEPTTPCLQIRPTRTRTDVDERLRLVRGTTRTVAEECERRRALPFCYHVSASRRRFGDRWGREWVGIITRLAY